MSDHGFPGLGFDPAPGSLETVTSLASALASAQKELTEACATVRQVASGGHTWQGAAAESFARRVGELPKHLDTAQQSFGEAAGELESWQTHLAGMKRSAQDLESQAEAARKSVEQAKGNPDLGLSGLVFNTGPELQQAQQRFEAAAATLTGAENELDGLVEAAKRLLQQHRELAEQAAKAVERAAHMAPPGPGFFAGILDGMEKLVQGQIKLAEDVGDWVKAHANAINAVGDMLATASTAIGLVGVALDCTGFGAPVGAVLDGVSAGLSGAALATHLVAKAAGAPVSNTTLLEDGLGVASFGISKAAEGAKVAIDAGKAVPKVVHAVANGSSVGAALGVSGLTMSMNDTAHDPTGLGYFLPRNSRQAAELGSGAVVPVVGPFAVGFENAWKHGSAEDREAAKRRAEGQG